MGLREHVKTTAKQLWIGLTDLLYPQFCLSCDCSLSGDSNTFICLSCNDSLPFTNYHELEQNPVTDRFAARVPLFFGGAFLVYKNNSITQKLIATFKYANRPDIAEGLGALYGQQLSTSQNLQGLDLIVPVPLHPKRQYKRGYNQAEMIAKGMSRYLKVPYSSTVLRRNTFETSQTKKGQQDRFKNVAQAFEATSTSLDGKKVLLVDDVLTTGATLEACADALIAGAPKVQIGVATIGFRE